VARPDVDALRSQVSAAATDPELEPAERVSSLRRLRDLVDMARDQARASLRDQLELIDSLTAIIGSADTYIGDNELRRDAQGMDKALTLARMRENADLHERMVAQGVSPEDLADAGFLTHDEIDEAESDGTIEEAAFGLAARFREWMVKRDHGKFSKKNVAGDAPAAPAARPAAPAPAQRGARPKPFVPKPRPAQAARPAAPAPAAPAPAQKPLAADAAPDERATHPALPKSPGVLGMGKIKPEDMHAIDDDMRAMVKAGEDEKPKQNFNGADDLFKAATEDFDPFKGLLDQAAQGLGGKTVDIKKAEKDAGKGISKPMLVMGPMKKMERAKQKVDTKYDGDWNRLQDVLRATMVVPTLADMPAAMDSIREQAEKAGWSIQKAENRYLDPPPPHNVGPTGQGYRDAAVALVSPNGVVSELQLNTAAMFHAKQTEGHHLYEEWRNIEATVKARKKTGPYERAAGGPAAASAQALGPTPEERKQMADLEMAQKKLYQGAWEKSYGG